MNIIKTTLFALATLASIGASAQKNNWQLVWHEEFNEDGKLNEKIWNYENGFVRNHEDQWYQADNAWCERGLLIIEGRTEKRPNPLFNKDGNDWRTSRDSIKYTSSCITTRWPFYAFA